MKRGNPWFVLVLLFTCNICLAQVLPEPEGRPDILCNTSSTLKGYCFCDELDTELTDSVWCWTEKGFYQPILRYYFNGARRAQIHYHDSTFTNRKEYLLLNDNSGIIGKWYWSEIGKLTGYYYRDMETDIYYWKGRLGNSDDPRQSKKRCKGHGNREKFLRNYPPKPDF